MTECWVNWSVRFYFQSLDGFQWNFWRASRYNSCHAGYQCSWQQQRLVSRWLPMLVTAAATRATLATNARDISSDSCHAVYQCSWQQQQLVPRWLPMLVTTTATRATLSTKARDSSWWYSRINCIEGQAILTIYTHTIIIITFIATIT